jgi:hypothetical protein
MPFATIWLLEIIRVILTLVDYPRNTYRRPTQSATVGPQAMSSCFEWRPVPGLTHGVFNEAFEMVNETQRSVVRERKQICRDPR